MIKIIYNDRRHDYSIYEYNSNSGKDLMIFESRDITKIFNYAIQHLGIREIEFNNAIDYLNRMKHTVMEFGINKTLTVTYNLDN
jgi:hypothetical protein